ncbi:MAG: glycosyltransferase family 2 protein [Candidatus Kapabacteria bacterium]|jgi:glycosyltransferase involved in cell wall biosynthesis|nr:glycosyltransferase family 2 protein [Candidatus Kapabacteria bacterium]
MTKLSIITVCLNEAKTIEKTLKSVIDQTFTDYEYIVIDGDSTDGTLEITDEFRDRIDIVISEPDTGIYNAMNKGIKKATGEYVFFLNAGDNFLNKHVLQLLFSKAPSADLVYCDMSVQINNGFVLRKQTPKSITKAFMYADSIPHQATFTKKEMFVKHANFDESYKVAADYELSLNLIFSQNISTEYYPLIISEYNLLGISASEEHRKQFFEERLKAQKKYLGAGTVSLCILLKPLILLRYKFLPIAYYMLRSKLSPNYLKNSDG